jgi:hypothetical protein
VLIGVLSHRRPVIARLRSDALHHAGGRRRGGAARHRPDAELVLSLQRSIGNRATTRLLREPTGTQVAQRSTPHVLKTAGITTDSRVNDETPKWIQAALDESQKLRPYLKGKFPKSAVTKDFEIHSVEDDFNQAAKTMYRNTEPMTKDQRAAAYGKIGGFFDRGTRKIHVRSRTKFGHAVHEAMHKVAHSSFHGFWGEFINEGVTQYFADCLLREQGLSIVTDHDYKAQLECAKKLVAATSFEAVAAGYFRMDQGLHDALLKHLNTDINKLLDARKANKVCALL